MLCGKYHTTPSQVQSPATSRAAPFFFRIVYSHRLHASAVADWSVGPAPWSVARGREGARAELPEGKRPQASAGEPASAAIAGIQGEFFQKEAFRWAAWFRTSLFSLYCGAVKFIPWYITSLAGNIFVQY